jgi:hypothetical protein
MQFDFSRYLPRSFTASMNWIIPWSGGQPTDAHRLLSERQTGEQQFQRSNYREKRHR